MTSFLKMHGLGNDFVVFDSRQAAISLAPSQARMIADRHRGIGCDQVIVVENGSDGADANMRIYNADGGEVESCGNAARCIARLLIDETGGGAVSLRTLGGLLSCSSAGSLITVNMGVPRFAWREIPLSEPRETLSFQIPRLDDHLEIQDASAVNVGNPHCVLFVESAQSSAVEQVGPLVERNPLFPERTNVEFVQVVSRDRLRMRVWERGAGETLACGTGACAAMAAARRRDLCGTTAEVELDGGILRVEWGGEDSPIFMTGPAFTAFRGDVNIDALV